MFRFCSTADDFPLYDLAPVNKAFRTSSWTQDFVSPNCTIKTAATNGSFDIFGCGTHMGSHAQSGRPDKGRADNEFGAWMDAHDLFRACLKGIYGERNEGNLDCDLRHMRIKTPTRMSPARYLVVPRRPIVLADHAGGSHRLEGVEAGIAWMALAWLESCDRHGTSGVDLINLHGTNPVRHYVEGFANDLRTAACQFPAGAALLD